MTFGRSTCERPSFSTCFGASTEKCCFQKNHVRFLTIDSFFSRKLNSLLSLLSYSNVFEVVCALVEGGGDFDGIWPIVPLLSFKPLFCRVSSSVGKKQLNAKTWMQMWKLDSFVSLKQCSGGDLTQIFFLWHKTGFSPPPGREMTLSCVCRYPFLHYFAKTQTFSQIPPSVCCKIIRKSFGIVFMCTGMWIRFFFFPPKLFKKAP